MTKARVNADNASADIQGVTAGTGLSGGGTSGTVTLTNDMATTIDAKGDLVVGTGADTYSRLATGNNGETLVADSSQTTGLRYNPPVGSLANPVINGGMDIWQRGTSIAGTTTGFSADRWQSYRAVAGSTFSRQTVSDSTNLPNIQFCARVQRDSGNTSTSALYLTQSFETTNSIPFAGKTVTLSFYARAGANYSSSSSGLTLLLSTGTGTDQNILAGYTGQANPIFTIATLTTTWQRFTYTATLAATTTEIGLQFTYTPVGTAGANDWFEITGVQVDVGTWTSTTAPTFRRSGGTLAGEVFACERYYKRFDTGGNNYNPLSQGFPAQSSTQVGIPVQYATMRTAPSSIDYGNLSVYGGGSGGLGFYAVTSASLTRSSVNIAEVLFTVSSGLTTGNTYRVQPNNAAGYIALNAEL